MVLQCNPQMSMPLLSFGFFIWRVSLTLEVDLTIITDILIIMITQISWIWQSLMIFKSIHGKYIRLFTLTLSNNNRRMVFDNGELYI